VCWACGSNLFAAAGRRVGSVVLNRMRIVMAMLLLGLALWITHGSPWPGWATPMQLGVLSLSGLIGFVFGDTFYFRALVILGPGRAALFSSVSPLFTALIAWPLLHELPGPLALLGMAMILTGVTWVLGERRNAGPEPDHAEGSVAVGILAGFLSALGQAGGYVLSKMALRTGIDPLSATVIRITAACVGIWTIAAIQGAAVRSFASLRDRKAALFMLGGAFCGPFLGVTLSLLALVTVEAAVAASITAISPILAMVIASRFHGERITWRSMTGAVIAVAGVIVLFLR
jgi:drug/metabolite transporter (DMT)-like permease